MKTRIFAPLFLFSLFILIGSSGYSTPPDRDGIYADLITNRGTVTVQLFYKRAPMTVLNFIGLSDGSKSWTDPRTGKPGEGALYRNISIHRVVDDFVVQMGDPLGNGTGGPGYTFEDEFHNDLKHDKAGILSMANAGPGTNGSQFFITLNPTPHLDGRHSVFGTVVNGMDVVKKIKQNDILQKVQIYRKGKEASAFDTNAAQKYYASNQKEEEKRQQKIVPDNLPPEDPDKMPKVGQQYLQPGMFEYILIGYKEAELGGKNFFYSRDNALQVATKIVRHCRSKNVSFNDMVQKYSDTPYRKVKLSAQSFANLPKLKEIFYLLPDQISPPIDSGRGIFSFRRLKDES